MEIRPLDPRDAEGCDTIIAGLPEWFELEVGIEECAAAVRSQPGIVAVDDDGVVGFATYLAHYPESAEITWMAVRRERHGQGVGTAIMAALVAAAAAGGARVLTVKTLGESHPDPGGYVDTRAFYQRMGFHRIEENTAIWGEENPCLILVRPLD
jgi:GNAT superfamily N-acetyltransferase